MSGMLDFMAIPAMGMKVQSDRMEVISENIANADTLAVTPGGDPYQRKIPTFESYMDDDTGVSLVRMGDVEYDDSDFELKFMPGHPGANEEGYVKAPNVNTLIEVMDMREAQRTYEANLGMIDQMKSMLGNTIDLLKS